jgi:hypothetical protein
LAAIWHSYSNKDINLSVVFVIASFVAVAAYIGDGVSALSIGAVILAIVCLIISRDRILPLASVSAIAALRFAVAAVVTGSLVAVFGLIVSVVMFLILITFTPADRQEHKHTLPKNL